MELPREQVAEIERLLSIAYGASRKLESMYACMETQPRAELDWLIEERDRLKSARMAISALLTGHTRC